MHCFTILQLKESPVTVSMFDDALKQKRKEIYEEFEKTIRENDPEKMKTLLKLAEKTAADIQDLTKIESFKNEIDTTRQQLDDCQRKMQAYKQQVEYYENELLGLITRARNKFQEETIYNRLFAEETIYNRIIEKTTSEDST